MSCSLLTKIITLCGIFYSSPSSNSIVAVKYNNNHNYVTLMNDVSYLKCFSNNNMIYSQSFVNNDIIKSYKSNNFNSHIIVNKKLELKKPNSKFCPVVKIHKPVVKKPADRKLVIVKKPADRKLVIVKKPEVKKPEVKKPADRKLVIVKKPEVRKPADRQLVIVRKPADRQLVVVKKPESKKDEDDVKPLQRIIKKEDHRLEENEEGEEGDEDEDEEDEQSSHSMIHNELKEHLKHYMSNAYLHNHKMKKEDKNHVKFLKNRVNTMKQHIRDWWNDEEEDDKEDVERMKRIFKKTAHIHNKIKAY